MIQACHSLQSISYEAHIYSSKFKVLTFIIPYSAIIQWEKMWVSGLDICDRPRENRPSSHLGMIVEIRVLKIVISITSFCSC